VVNSTDEMTNCRCDPEDRDTESVDGPHVGCMEVVYEENATSLTVPGGDR
jgi:hypothetical protein